MLVDHTRFPSTLTASLIAKEPFAICFSGGLDSRFLAHVAHSIGCDFIALHIRGVHIPHKESEEARAWATNHAIPFFEIEADISPQSPILRNPKNRCYLCKKMIFQKMKAFLRAQNETRSLLDGTNLDDTGEYRPGNQAIREEGIFSPLKFCSLRKKDIRFLARETGLENPDQLSSACLFTRFPYDVPLDPCVLTSISLCEEKIRSLLSSDSQTQNLPFRLRVMESCVLQIPFLLSSQYGRINALLEENGFFGTRLFLSDHISGFYDTDHPRIEDLPLLSQQYL